MVTLTVTIAALALALALTGMAWKRRSLPGNKYLGLFTLILAVWFAVHILELIRPSLREMLFWDSVHALSSAMWAVFLIYVLVYTGRDSYIKKPVIALLAVEPFLFFILTNLDKQLLWARLDARLVSDGFFTHLIYRHGVLSYLDMGYCLTLIMISFGLLFDFLNHATRLYQKQAVTFLLAAGFPALLLVGDIFNVFPEHTNQLHSLGYYFLVLVLGVGVFRYKILDLAAAERAQILEVLPYGLIVLDAAGRVVDINSTAQSILNCRADEVLGRTEIPNLNHQAYLTSETAYLEMRLANAGSAVDYVLQISPLKQVPENQQGWLLILIDISENKNLQLSLHESEQKYRLLAEKANDGIIMVQDLQFVYVNEQAARMIGYKVEELIGQPFDKFMPAELLRDIVDKHKRRLAGEEVADRFELSFIHRLGYPVTLESNASLIEVDGKPAVLGILRDITARKAQEEIVQRSQEQLAAILEAVSDGIIVLDKNGQIVYANEGNFRIFGFNSLEEYGKTTLGNRFDQVEIFTEEDKPVPMEELPGARALRGLDCPPVILKVRDRQKKTVAWYFLSTKTILDPQGELLYVVVGSHDLTPQKKGEKSLREAGQFLNTIITSAQEGIVVYDCDLRYVVWNPFMERLTGMKAQDVLGKVSLDTFPHMREVGLDAILQKVLLGESITSDDMRMIIPQTGKTGWVVGSYSPHYDGQGNIIGVVGILMDVSERRYTEEQVRKLSISVEQSPTIVLITDTKGFIEYVNPKFTQITGYTAEEVIAKRTSILRSEGTDDKVYEDLWKTINSGAEWRGELRNRKKDGTLFWVLSSISPVLDSAGKVTHYLAIQEDVTERKRLEDAEHRRLQELESLRATMADISSELDMSKLLKKIMERVLFLLNVERGMLALYRPESDDLEIVVSLNQHRNFSGMRVKIGEGGMGKSAELRRPLIIENYQDWDNRISEFEVDWPYSIINVPLISGQELLGVITAGANTMADRFSSEDVQLMEMFALEAALAVRNAQLLEETRRLAITDGLTGLYNRRHFMTLAAFEHERSRRYLQPLSMIMFDIDHFKRVNDRYGHLAGDQVLQAIARQARDEVRSVDIVARYGGEEFVVMMPETALNQAQQMAERLRNAAEEMQIDTSGGLLQITISVGVASLQSGMQDIGALLNQTDQAMYRAKQSGRNRVSL